jgi:hypothetical protein
MASLNLDKLPREPLLSTNGRSGP